MANKSEGIKNKIVERVRGLYEELIEDTNKLMGLGAVVVLIVAGVFYWRYSIEEGNVEASEMLSAAMVFYNAGEFQKAVAGDSAEVKGLAAIVEEYGSTQTGKQAMLFLGNAYLKLGRNDEALEVYSAVPKSAGSLIYAGSLSGLATCYSNKKDYQKAGEFYWNAAENSEWDVFIPIYLEQAGINYELAGNHKQAFDLFQKIKKQYPESEQARKAEFYAVRAKLNLE